MSVLISFGRDQAKGRGRLQEKGENWLSEALIKSEGMKGELRSRIRLKSQNYLSFQM